MSAPRVIDLRADPERDLADVAEHIRQGGAIAYPTETVYGFGGALSAEGVSAVLALKSRGPERPLIILVRSAQEVDQLKWTDAARELASIFWPGSLTLVLSDPQGIFPTGVRSESGAVAVRVSPQPVVTRLLEALGAPLTSTSVNAPGEAPSVSGTEALETTLKVGGQDVIVLDVGTLHPSGPSTIVDCTGQEPKVLREGAIPIERLRCAIPGIDV